MSSKISAPKSLENLLLRLFGDINIANKTNKTEKEWREALSKILDELNNYFSENLETNEFHSLLIQSGLASAHDHLKNEDDFDEALLGYVEGIVRFALILMGDFPNHSKRKGGRKKKTHYEMERLHKLYYNQSPNQKYFTLILANQNGFEFEKDPELALKEFRDEYGSQKDLKEFLDWYRKNYPKDYTKVF